MNFQNLAFRVDAAVCPLSLEGCSDTLLQTFFFKLGSQIQLLVNFQNLAFRVDAAAHQRLPNDMGGATIYIHMLPAPPVYAFRLHGLATS